MDRTYNFKGMEKYKKYMNISNPYNPFATKTKIRMVNQREMFEFILRNQGVTEGEIQMQVYSYSRSAYEGGVFLCSNKKYADCLRRLLDSKTIFREEYKKGRYVYFTSPSHPRWEGIQIDEAINWEEIKNSSKVSTGDIIMKKEDFEKSTIYVREKGKEKLDNLKMKFSWIKEENRYKFTVTKQDVADMMGININDLQILV